MWADNKCRGYDDGHVGSEAKGPPNKTATTMGQCNQKYCPPSQIYKGNYPGRKPLKHLREHSRKHIFSGVGFILFECKPLKPVPNNWLLIDQSIKKFMDSVMLLLIQRGS